MPSIFHTQLIDWIRFKSSLIYLYIQVLLSVYSDNSGNRLQIVNFPSKRGILIWQLFTICDLTTFLGFHVRIADSTPSTIPRIMHNSCYDVLLWCYSKVSKVHETVTVQRSCVFIIFPQNSWRGSPCFIQSIQANLHMNYFLENTYESWQAKRYIVLYQILNIWMSY